MDDNLFRIRLGAIIEERGIKQIELARSTGISKATISQYLSGQYNAKPERVAELAKALRCNPLWLEGYDVDKDAGVGEDSDDILETGSLAPVLEPALDGRGRIERSRILSREYIGREWRDKDCFFIRMPDHSMEPMIHMGDLLLCEKCGRLENGEIGLFVLSGREICVKRYVTLKNGTALLSADKRWPECFYRDGEDDGGMTEEPFRIEGRIVQCTHKFI